MKNPIHRDRKFSFPRGHCLLSSDQKCKFPSHDSGFTLIELLIVLVIIGILVTLSTFGLQGARESARDQRRKADLETVRSGLEIYRSDCGVYPGSLPSPGYSLVGDDSTSSCLSTNNYISEMPGDPQGSVAYEYNVVGGSYELCAMLEQVPKDPYAVGGCSSCGPDDCYRVVNP